MDDRNTFSNNNVHLRSRTESTRDTIIVFSSFSLLLALGVAFFIYNRTLPTTLPAQGIVFEITKGMSIRSISDEAYADGLVRSPFLLHLILRYVYDSKNIYAGVYRFDTPLNVFGVAEKLSQSDVDKTLLSVTIPEGTTRKDIAKIAQNKIQNFDSAKFLELTKDKEGYLFPDTYQIRPDFTAEEFVDLLTRTYALKLAPYKDAIAQSGFTEAQVITLASIIEREAKDEESMRTVSGILQNRLSMHMPLQTDATMEYVLDKSLAELTADDLTIDTPYNTYLHAGLPPTPIGNPGLQSIQAVLDPIKTKYLYYLTDQQGVFHYSTTFEAHKQNIQKYLK